MSLLHIDRENHTASSRTQTAHGAKRMDAGLTAPSRITQRKPLGEVNVNDTKHQSNAKPPLRVKASLSTVTAPVEMKPHSQTHLSQRPKSSLCSKEQRGTKMAAIGREQEKLKSDRAVPPQQQVLAEAKCSNVDQDDSDIELMFPAPDEDDFSNWFPASEMSLASRLKSWQPPVSRSSTELASPLPSPPQFDPHAFDGLTANERHGVVPLPDIFDLHQPEDEPDLEYFSSLQI